MVAGRGEPSWYDLKELHTSVQYRAGEHIMAFLCCKGSDGGNARGHSRFAKSLVFGSECTLLKKTGVCFLQWKEGLMMTVHSWPVSYDDQSCGI